MHDIVYLFLTFIFYSFLGFILETTVIFIETKRVVKRGLLNGPILPIYGIVATLLILCTNNIKDNIPLTVLVVLLICSSCEYIGGLLTEKILKIKLWDYSQRKYNIKGRICLIGCIFFLIMGLILIYGIYPITKELFIYNKFNLILSIILFIGFICDYIFSIHVVNKLNLVKTTSGDATSDIRKYTKTIIK